jgi:hypothetical protein
MKSSLMILNAYLMSEITLYRPVFEKHASAKKLDKSKLTIANVYL